MTRTITETLKQSDDAALARVLEHADPMVLMGLLNHAGCEEDFSAIGTINVLAGLSSATIVQDPADAARIRTLALDLLRDYRDGRRQPPEHVEDGALLRAMQFAVGQSIPPAELGLHRDVMALHAAPQGWQRPRSGASETFNVVVIGAGLAGINAAVELKASGIDFVVLDKNAGPGGTWCKNRYPGARVDWPSRLYSHGFGVDFPFAHTFAPRAENEEYLRWCVDRYDLGSHMEFGIAVCRMEWLEGEGVWQITARDNAGSERTWRARAVISAIGLLDRPYVPPIPGLEDFGGHVCHSSTFDPSYPLADRRVAVVGTGASGLQMVPDLAPQVGSLAVFQRSPAWVIPLPGYRDPLSAEARWLDANVPFYTNWMRFALGWMLGDHRLYRVFEVDPDWTDPDSVNEVNKAARDFAMQHIQKKLASRPELLAKSVPDYPIFANRPVIDNGWFDALVRDNVELVTDPIACFTETCIRTQSGQEYPVDLAVMATGFNPNDYFAEIEIVGRDGVSARDVWRDTGPRAFWGIAVPHLPNLFILYGPNANPRNLGPVQYGEWAIAHILEIFRQMVDGGWKSVEVRQDAYDNFNSVLDVRCQDLVSVNPRTTHASYYIRKPGQTSVQSPWSSAEVWAAFGKVDLENYIVDRDAVVGAEQTV